MQKALLWIFKELVSVVGGGLTGALGTVLSLVKSGTRAAFQFHQEGISLARDLGMGLNQANSYTKVLTERTQELAAKYGVTSEAIMKVQRNISETTGKQLLLNGAQAEGFVQANKLIGEQNANRFIDTIMNGMGGQISTVQGAISKAYATAMKQGLNAQKFSKTVADNLSMANRLNFRNGIDGITRMAAMAEKFGMRMNSVETAAGQFMELDSAIEHSAHLQMLGGSIGAAFSNPLQNAYESMYDPEALAKKMENAMKGMATFDVQKGYATISPINQNTLREYAKEMGFNAEEVIANAKKIAEVSYKENQFSDKLGGLNLSEDQKNFLINNGQVSEGGKELLFNGQNVNAMDPKELKKQLDNMMQFEGKSDTDILKDQATSLRSIEEAINGNLVSAIASFAKGLKLETFASEIIGGVDDVGKIAQKIGEFLGEKAHDLIESIIKGVDDIEKWYTKHEKEIKETLKKIKDIIDKVHKACSFLGNHWHELLAAFVGLKLTKGLLRMKLPGGKPTLGNKLGTKVADGLRKAAKWGVKGLWNGVKGAFKIGANIITKGARGAAKLLTSAGKGTASAWKELTNSISKTKIAKNARTIWNRAKASYRATTRLNGKSAARGVWNATKNIGKNMARLAPKTTNALKLGGKVLSIGGLALAGYDVYKGGEALDTYNAKKRDLDSKLASGAMSKAEYDAQTREALIDKRKDQGKGFGAIVGGAIGGYFGGTTGAGLGAWVGSEAGGWIGKQYTDAEEAVKGFWNGTVRDAAQSAFGDLGASWVDGVGSLMGGITGGIGTYIEHTLHGVSTSINGAISGFKQMLNGDIIGGLKTFKDTFQNVITDAVKGISGLIGGIGKGVWGEIKDFSKGVIKQFFGDDTLKKVKESWVGDVYKNGEKFLSGLQEDPRGTLKKAYNKVTSWLGFDEGGIVDGDSYTGDKKVAKIARVNSGEMIITRNQQANLFDFLTKIGSSNGVTYYNASNKYSNLASSYDTSRISSMLDNRSIKEKHSVIHNNVGGNILSNILSTIFNSNSNVVSSALNTNNNIKTVPFGENSFRKIPKSDYTEYSYNKGGEITVKDINLNINGTIKLDAGTLTKNLDTNQLLSDTTFISSLKDLIKQSINNDINNGRFMNDIASMRGMPSQITTWGRK